MRMGRTSNERHPGKGLKTPSYPAEFLEQSIAHFAIDGHQFVAIPQGQWSAFCRKGQNDPSLRPSGVVRLDGVRHVLIARGRIDSIADDSSPLSSLLTSRELQIAYAVADGKCDKVIAHELGISEYTVREHMRRIFHKLQVSKRAAVVARLITARFEGALPRG